MAKSKRRSGSSDKPKPYDMALRVLHEHPLLGRVADALSFRPVLQTNRVFERRTYCRIESRLIIYNQALSLTQQQWLGVFALATLALAVGGGEQADVPNHYCDAAAQLAALHWWRAWKIGELPEHIDVPDEVLAWGRLPLPDIITRLRNEPLAQKLDAHWLLSGSPGVPLIAVRETQHTYQPTSTVRTVFANALADAAKRALALQRDTPTTTRVGVHPDSIVNQAKRWLITHVPLLGSLLAQFEIIEDLEMCRRMDIGIAAISAYLGEIYVNPARALPLEQAKFVLAHEVLHAGLAHAARRRGRDPYLWNVACDFVINDWLVQLNLGQPPAHLGLLFDEGWRGQSAEEIYLHIAGDLRLRRRLCTMRGDDVDMLDERVGNRDGGFTDREEFYRRALAQGLDFHQAYGRGLVPAGLEEAIRTLAQPPIPWQAQLAEWIRERVPLPERHRTYAKPSRRQSATPDIPRPRFYEPEDLVATHTFGVILDTSGSMERDDLGNALGAIVSYARQQKVRAVRLVYCDGEAYDEGFVEIETLAHRVRVRGRGGTVSQRAVQLLESRPDFPKPCSILVVTDGMCENDLTITRDHAFLLPPGRGLPFRTHQPVFYME